MKENVGRADRAMRLVLGPALAGAGLGLLGAGRGNAAGVAALVAGVLVLESGITRTCPLNQLAGIDTREADLRARDRTEELRAVAGDAPTPVPR
jgi:hypothetical protein